MNPNQTTAQTGHTPLPWHAFEQNAGGTFWQIGTEANPHAVAIGLKREDAELIILAVNNHARLERENAALRTALDATEAKLTAVARAFYVGGKASELKAAFEGWKVVAELARAALANTKGTA